jgi:hypothetical protein
MSSGTKLILAKGLTAAGADYAFPKAFHAEAPTRSGKRAAMTGAKFAVASYITQMSPVPVLVASAGVSGRGIEYVSDGVLFAGVEALTDKHDRSMKSVLMNALYGVGISAVACKAVAPYVDAYVPDIMPASPLQIQNQATGTTSPGFAS